MVLMPKLIWLIIMYYTANWTRLTHKTEKDGIASDRLISSSVTRKTALGNYDGDDSKLMREVFLVSNVASNFSITA